MKLFCIRHANLEANILFFSITMRFTLVVYHTLQDTNFHTRFSNKKNIVKKNCVN